MCRNGSQKDFFVAITQKKIFINKSLQMVCMKGIEQSTYDQKLSCYNDNSLHNSCSCHCFKSSLPADATILFRITSVKKI